VVMRDFAATGNARGAPLRFVDTLEPA
jgi:hypothetical protein